MAKRFEDVTVPTFGDLVAAYPLLGVEGLLGSPGEHTAFWSNDQETEEIVLHILPGTWTGQEFAELVELATSGVTAPVALPLAA